MFQCSFCVFLILLQLYIENWTDGTQQMLSTSLCWNPGWIYNIEIFSKNIPCLNMLVIWAYGNNGYGKKVRWSCSDKNLYGKYFTKCPFFIILLLFILVQIILKKSTNDQINIRSLSKFGCTWILESSIMQRCSYWGRGARTWHIS